MITALCLLLSAALSGTPALSPTNEVVARTILIEVAQDGTWGQSTYNAYHNQCHRFQEDSFAAAAAGYALAAFPDVPLAIPREYADRSSGRSGGTAWAMPDEAAGNPFVEVARFDWNRSLTAKQNLEAAKEFLTQVRAGDFFQMNGEYTNGGRGKHTLMFTRPYDPRDEKLYWSDSNFTNRKVGDIRYGQARAYQNRALAEIAKWIARDSGTGATLYRLREDLIQK